MLLVNGQYVEAQFQLATWLFNEYDTSFLIVFARCNKKCSFFLGMAIVLAYHLLDVNLNCFVLLFVSVRKTLCDSYEQYLLVGSFRLIYNRNVTVQYVMFQATTMRCQQQLSTTTIEISSPKLHQRLHWHMGIYLFHMFLKNLISNFSCFFFFIVAALQMLQRDMPLSSLSKQ